MVINNKISLFFIFICFVNVGNILSIFVNVVVSILIKILLVKFMIIISNFGNCYVYWWRLYYLFVIVLFMIFYLYVWMYFMVLVSCIKCGMMFSIVKNVINLVFVVSFFVSLIIMVIIMLMIINFFYIFFIFVYNDVLI